MSRYSNAGSGDSGHPQEDSADESGVGSAGLRGKWRVEAKKRDETQLGNVFVVRRSGEGHFDWVAAVEEGRVGGNGETEG